MRVAVALYGLLRTFNETAPSVDRRIVRVHGADVFVFTPSSTDQPAAEHQGKLDWQGHLVDSPKTNLIGRETPATLEAAAAILGDALKKAHVYPLEKSTFDWADDIAKTERLFLIDPKRIASMFFNMQGALRLVEAHEAATGQRYDYVVLTRPDLCFFEDLRFPAFPAGEVHIPAGVSYDQKTGRKSRGNAPVFFYKNTDRGICIAGDTHRFTDQLMVFHRDDVAKVSSIYDELPRLLAERVPLNPESILFTWLRGFHDLRTREHPEWFYEIRRHGLPPLLNVTDLESCAVIEPNNPRARAFIRRRRGRYYANRLRFKLKERLQALVRFCVDAVHPPIDG